MRSLAIPLTVSLLVLALPAWAQDVNNSVNIGFPANGVFDGSDFDTIQLNNLDLHLEIPLWTYPGRGLPVSFKYVYDNRGWYLKTTCPHFADGCVDVVRPEPGNNMILHLAVPTDYHYTSKYGPMNCNGIKYLAFWNKVLREPDGTKHHMLPDPDPNPEPRDGGQVCWGPKGTPSYADDGSGWVSNSTGTFRKDGTRVGGASEDTNGNQLMSSGTSFTDTLGRTINGDGSYYDSAGTLRQIQVITTTVAVQTHLCASAASNDICHEYSGTWTAPQQIILPNGLKYTFTYEQNQGGEPSSVILPTGAQITWTWGESGDGGGRQVATRTVTEGGQSYTWHYDALYGPVDPLGNQTRVYFSILTNTCFRSGHPELPYITKKEFYEGAQLRKTVETHYQNSCTVLPDIETTTWAGSNQVSKVATTYDQLSTWSGNISWSNPTSRTETAYGVSTPGPVVRSTTFSYLHQNNSAYRDLNIADRLVQKTVYDAAGARVADSHTDYDDANALIASLGGVPNHDPARGTSYLTRGNPTRVSHWLHNPIDSSVPDTWLTTYNTYDDLGNLRWTTEPDGVHTTYFSYSDNWWANTLCVPAGVNTQAFVTQVTNALGQASQSFYYPCTGQIGQSRDPNDIAANRNGTLRAYDKMNRLLSVSTPDGGLTSLCYSDDVSGNCYNPGPLTATKTVKLDGSQNIVSKTIRDGLGRAKQTQLTDPVCASGPVKVDFTYDALGRKSTESNPYCLTTDPTYGLTAYQYDALDRVTKMVPQDGNSNYNNVTTDYGIFPAVTVTDEQGMARRSTSDALGRLVKVEEPGGTPAPATAAGSMSVAGAERSSPVTSGAVAGAGSVAISGAEQSYSVDSCDDFPPYRCRTFTGYDAGSVSITVNGFAKSVSFGRNSTASTIASALAAALQGDPASPVIAGSSGPTVTLNAKVTGTASNYSLSATQTWDTANFGGPSFNATPSGAALTGGSNGNTTYTYDSGTVWISVAGFTANVTFGQNSLLSDVVSALAAQFNGSATSPVTANVSGGSALNFTAKLPGSVGNYVLSSGWTSNFNPASFTTSPTNGNLIGGADGMNLTTPAVTFYTYDALDNLTCVVQKGTDTTSFTTCAAAPASWRPRSFVYDSLARLLISSNPESGTINYNYDVDGNLISKTAPAPNQSGSATVTTTYGYDALHRLTGKTYSSGDPSVSYLYDQTSYNGLTILNGIGRRTGLADASGQTAWSYDVVNRQTTEQRKIGTITKTITAGSNYNGSLASQLYPSGRTINYTYNAAGRMTSAVDAASAINYATAATYTPTGALASFKNGATSGFAGITTSNSYNNRLQPVTLSAAAPSVTVLSLTYNFDWGHGNNGNVRAIVNNRDATRTQNFTYDALNRVYQAYTSGPNWGQTFTIDLWGNLTNKAGYAGKSNYDPLNAAPADTHNRLPGFGYDAAGNLTSNGSATYTYDAENRITSTAGVTYVYDGDGVRVKKSGGSAAPTLYWGETFSSGPLAESDAAGNPTAEYIFLGGKRIARVEPTVYPNCAPPPPGQQANCSPSTPIYYYFSDHLGTAEVITNATGGIVKESDYYPYGGEIAISGSDPNHFKFTGKERDPESGLDYFGVRYYGSATGRFVQSDLPFADWAFDNPQSLNLYAYVRNNPLRMVDPNGRGAWDVVKGAVIGTGNFISNTVIGGGQLAVAAVQDAGSAVPIHISELMATPVMNAAEDYSTKGVAGVVDDVLAQGEQGAMETVTEAVLTGGLAASGRVNSIAAEGSVVESGAARTGAVPKQGIYEAPDATAPGRTYVGQSGDIPRRLTEQQASGKFPPGTNVKVTEVKGGKVAREVAEHNRIQELGGVKSQPGSKTSNVRNPIGKNRHHVLKKNP